MNFFYRSGARFEFYLSPIFVIMASYGIVSVIELLAEPIKQYSIAVLCLMFISIYLAVIYNSKVELRYTLFLYTFAGIALTALIIKMWKHYSSERLKFITRSFALGLLLAFVALMVGSPWNPIAFGYSYNSMTRVENAKPQYPKPFRDALDWVRQNTEEDAVIAAWWDFGSWINLYADRTTIIDEEHDDERIQQFAEHVMIGKSVSKTLDFLKNYNVDYLLITEIDCAHIAQIASISNPVDCDGYLISECKYIELKDKASPGVLSF